LPDPVARINGEVVGRAELESAIEAVERQAGGPVPPEQRDEIFRGILDQMIAIRLLSQESALREIVVPDAEVDSRYAQIRQQFPTEEAFAQALAAQGITTARLKDDIRNELAVSRLLEREIEPKVSAAELDAKTFYEKNLEQFQEDEAVRASHILIRVAPDADDQVRQQARAEAENVLQQLQAGGDFAKLAQEYSQDGSAAQGGDLDFFTRGQMVPAFATAAFALQTNELSDIVETQFGLHIIKVTDRRPPRTVPFAEVDAQIHEFLSGQEREKATTAFVEALKRKGRVEVLF
jgi:peptidyl-prolyl cis-trans isomerase C